MIRYETLNFFETISDMFYYEMAFVVLTLFTVGLNFIITRKQSSISKVIPFEGGEQEYNDISKFRKFQNITKEQYNNLVKWIKYKLSPWLYQKVVYDALLRLFLEGYFDVCVACLPAINKITSWSNLPQGFYASQVLAVIHLLFIVIGFPLFVTAFFYYSLKTSSLQTSTAKYGSLYSELRYADSPSSLFYHLLFLLRRLLLITQATLIPYEHQFFNILLLLLTSSLLLTYLIRARPFENPLYNHLEVFNESIVLIASVYHCLMYSDLAQLTRKPEEYQMQAGWSFIAVVLAIQIPTNIGVIGWQGVKEAWLRRERIKERGRQMMNRVKDVCQRKVTIKEPSRPVFKLQLNNILIKETDRDDLMTGGPRQHTFDSESDRQISNFHHLQVPKAAEHILILEQPQISISNFIIEEEQPELVMKQSCPPSPRQTTVESQRDQTPGPMKFKPSMISIETKTITSIPHKRKLSHQVVIQEKQNSSSGKPNFAGSSKKPIKTQR